MIEAAEAGEHLADSDGRNHAATFVEEPAAGAVIVDQYSEVCILRDDSAAELLQQNVISPSG